MGVKRWGDSVMIHDRPSFKIFHFLAVLPTLNQDE
jgi:hypothetical protein